MTNQLPQKKKQSNSVKQDHFEEVIQKLTGTTNYELASEIIGLAAKASSERADAAQIALQYLNEEKPRDLTETRLNLQAHALYSQGMKNLARAEEADLPYQAELRMKFAMKLLRLHNETIETLNRYRRRGEQTVVVQHQHVQVNDGGKAIVGNQMVTGGLKTKTEEPHG
jgi:hypothetical protein